MKNVDVQLIFEIKVERIWNLKRKNMKVERIHFANIHFANFANFKVRLIKNWESFLFRDLNFFEGIDIGTFLLHFKNKDHKNLDWNSKLKKYENWKGLFCSIGSESLGFALKIIEFNIVY